MRSVQPNLGEAYTVLHWLSDGVSRMQFEDVAEE